MCAALRESLYRGGYGCYGRYFVPTGGMDAGQLCLRSTATNNSAEIVDPTNTGAADVLGVCIDSATYSTTQADFGDLDYPGTDAEKKNTVGIIVDPFAVYRLPVSGGALGGAALTQATGHVFTNTVADSTGLIITDAVAAAVSVAGGTVIGLTGNNAGVRRIIATYNVGADVRVLVPFPSTIAVGNMFLVLPFSRKTLAVQLCDTAGAGQFGEANAAITYGTGAPFRVLNVEVDIFNTKASLDVLAGDHFYNNGA